MIWVAKLQIVLGPTRSKIVGTFKDSKLDNAFSVATSKAFFRAGPRGFDPKKHYYRKGTQAFPTGLWRDIRKFLKGQGHTVTIKDTRTKPDITETEGWDQLQGIELRDYQTAAVKKVLHYGQGILHISTGGGKTEVMAGIIKALDTPKTLILTSKQALIQQTRERLAERLGIDPFDIGVATQGMWIDGDSGITVGLVSTIMQPKWKKKRQAYNTECQLLMLDEGHHAGAKGWYMCAQANKAYYRVGLTATPKGRSDGKDLSLRSVTGKVVHRVSAHKLIKRGFLAQPYVFYTDIHNPRLITNTYEEVYKDGIVKNEERNDIIVRYAQELVKAGRRVWIFVNRIEHGKLLEQRIRHSQFLAAARTSVIQQRVAADRFARGKLDVLILTNIFNEGVDTPAVDAIIMAAGGLSIIDTLQRVGRGMRAKEDNRLFVFDFRDQTHHVLYKHSEKRRKTCEAEKYHTTIWEEPKRLKRHVA